MRCVKYMYYMKWIVSIYRASTMLDNRVGMTGTGQANIDGYQMWIAFRWRKIYCRPHDTRHTHQTIASIHRMRYDLVATVENNPSKASEPQMTQAIICEQTPTNAETMNDLNERQQCSRCNFTLTKIHDTCRLAGGHPSRPSTKWMICVWVSDTVRREMLVGSITPIKLHDDYTLTPHRAHVKQDTYVIAESHTFCYWPRARLCVYVDDAHVIIRVFPCRCVLLNRSQHNCGQVWKKRSRIHPENVTPSLRLKLLVWRAICRLCFVRANTGKWGSTAMAHAMRQQHMEKRLRIPSTQSHTEHSHQFDSCMFRHLRDQMNADGVIHRARHIIQNASVCLCAVCLRCVLIIETSIYSLQFTLITKRTTSQVSRAIINVSLMDLTSDWWGGGIQDIAEWAKIYLNTHRKCGAQLVLTSISSNQ